MARTKNPAGTKAPAKKAAAPAKKATAKTATTGRKPRGWLAEAVLAVCKDHLSGKLKLDGKPLTPHRVAKVVQERTGAEDPPSTGAVSAVFKRWETFGFAKFNQKPFSFKAFTPKGEKEGLEAVITGRREARKAETAKANKAKAAAKKAGAAA